MPDGIQCPKGSLISTWQGEKTALADPAPVIDQAGALRHIKAPHSHGVEPCHTVRHSRV